jgi:prepilin-type N-terminal cleavage/methylation domain-containing protein
MRRTGSEEIGLKLNPRPRESTHRGFLPLVHFFGEAPERRPWILKHDDAGRVLPGFIFVFPFLLAGITHKLCYGAEVSRVHRRETGMEKGLWSRSLRSNRGFTLLELILVTTILSIFARLIIQGEKERRLRHVLWEMRDAIDKYKDAADRGSFQIKADSSRYPQDSYTLYKGVEAQGDKKIRFLRSIPTDATMP